VSTSEIKARFDALEGILGALEGELLELQQRPLGIDTKSSEVDFVTEADLLSEKRLLAFIRERFPDDSILSEECGEQAADAPDAASVQWILDPIDGTTNYANRLPIWGISAGLRSGETMVGGFVSAPGMGLRYRAVRGAGATCNGAPIRVNAKTSLAEGIVATGFPYDRAKRAGPLARAVEAILPEVGGLRRLGAATLDFCFLAEGRLTGYYEMGLKPWDYAAGSLIAEEAGARLSDFSGAPLDIFRSSGVVASNETLQAELLRIIGPAMHEASTVSP